MKREQLIEQIEGEATLHFELGKSGVDFVTVSFPHFRGMEQILQNKPMLDALVYTPRVCGICGHSHLMATVRALEDAMGNAVTLSPKAKAIRELTLTLELIQNHFKWFYLVIYPELCKLLHVELSDSLKLKGAYAASLTNKALALFSGQWPHSSYMIPGGVTTDPTHVDLIRAGGFIDEVIAFFEKESMGTSLDHAMTFSTCKEFNALESDISKIERLLFQAKMQKKGFAYDRFIVMGEHAFTYTSRLNKTVKKSLNPLHVSVKEAFSPDATSYALNAHYNEEYYEGGPLARAIANDVRLIKNMHRRFKDSSYSRVMARIYEIPRLLHHVKSLIHAIEISEPSYIKPTSDLKSLHAEGVGVVEAPRGPLMHKVSIEGGVISKYQIITPTQWNLGSGTTEQMGVAQKAMIGASSESEAAFIFKSFDVCSVCTTH